MNTNTIIVVVLVSVILCLSQYQAAESSNFSSKNLATENLDADEAADSNPEFKYDYEAVLRKYCPKPMEPAQEKRREKCLRELEITRLRTTVSKLWASKDYLKLGNLVCQIWPKFTKCLTETFDYVDTCFGTESTGKKFENLFDLNCSTETKKKLLGDFIMVGGPTCVVDMDLNAVARCVTEKEMEEGTQLAKWCNTFKRIRECGMPAFSACNSTKPWGSVSAGLEYFETLMSCHKLFRSSEL